MTQKNGAHVMIWFLGCHVRVAEFGVGAMASGVSLPSEGPFRVYRGSPLFGTDTDLRPLVFGRTAATLASTRHPCSQPPSLMHPKKS